MSADSASVLAWREELSALEVRLGELFVRAEPRRQAGLYLEGLLSAAKRKNGWQLAEQIGGPTLANAAGAQPRAVGPGRGPRSVPRLRHRASWGRGRRADRRRDRLPEEGRALGRGGAAVQRHGRPDRERPDRRLPDLRKRQGARADRPRALPARGVV